MVIGQVDRPHGVRGEVRAHATGPTLAGLALPAVVHLGEPVGGPRTLLTVRGTPPRVIVTFEGVHDRDAAAALTGAPIEVPAEMLPGLDEDVFYVRDLLGCRVLDGDLPVGEIADVLERPANDVLVVRLDGGEERLVPFHADFVVAVEPAGRQVRLAPGSLETLA